MRCKTKSSDTFKHSFPFLIFVKSERREIYVASPMIDIYAKLRFSLWSTKSFYNGSKVTSVIVLTAIISCIYLKKMFSNGLQPDPVTFAEVLTASAHSGVLMKHGKYLN